MKILIQKKKNGSTQSTQANNNFAVNTMRKAKQGLNGHKTQYLDCQNVVGSLVIIPRNCMIKP